MKNMEELAKKDEKWRSLAYMICRDKELADDLVQDMYIKSTRYDKEINDTYVFKILKSLFIDHVRSNSNKISIDLLKDIEDSVYAFEMDDTESKIMDKFNNLDWKQKELIEESYYTSLRGIQSKFPMINYGYAHRQIQLGIKEVLGSDYEKYKNSRMKYGNKK